MGMGIQIVDENGYFVRDYVGDIPTIEVEGMLVNDPHYIEGPVPIGFNLPKREDGEWVEGGEPPEPTPQPPSDIEKLEAKITAATDYADFLEEIIVEMAQAVYG